MGKITEQENEKRVEFENCITKAALESGLNFGTVLKSLFSVHWRFKQAQENLANEADVRKASDFAEHGLFIH